MSKNGQDWTEIYPNRIKRVHDNIPDIFALPISFSEIGSAQLTIYGKYRPAPYHRQIRIRYSFIQDGKRLAVRPSGSNIIEEELGSEAKGYLNLFNFQR